MRKSLEVVTVSAEAASSAIIAEASFGDDKLAKFQWYLDDSRLSDLSIDVYSVWEDYSGKGVKVGVIDTQIDFRHADLARAYDTSLDYNYAIGTSDVTIDPKALPNYHGTFVAGVISAELGNGIGTRGIASGATLVGLGIDYSSDEAVSQILSALNQAATLDVVNNSWRFITAFADNFARNPEYEAALQNAVANGRGGLGTSIVFAAGNTGASGTANYNNFQNSPFTIAVGAVDPNGNPSSFTSIGANVLISAAGREINSTTLNNGYTTASGTSFAAPAVSATIALMLEANPDLGYRDVQQILAYSARREGLGEGASYGDGWTTNGATNHNGGGLHFSDAFGYGYLNVHDAVRLAESWTKQQTFANLTEISQTTQVGQKLVAGTTDTIAIQFAVTQAMLVEHVQVAIDLNWRDSGNLDVYLVSPEGTRVRLVYDLDGVDRVGSFRGFEFASVASMGEAAAGIWRIEIVNNDPTAVDGFGAALSAQVRSATLTLQGNALGLENDTYIYTDEFGSLYSGDDLASRKTLRDKDGGTDTINAAAITSNSVIDLSGATATILAGIAVDIGKGVIENAFGGDGNDTLTGSIAANVLSGGRGNDTVHFSGGSDLVDGGQGSDTILLGKAFGAFSGYVTTAGEVALSLAAGVVTTIHNVETFVFSDITYSFEALVALLRGTDGDTGGDNGGGGTPDDGGDNGTGDNGNGDGDGDGGDSGGGPVVDPDIRTFDATISGTSGADKMRGDKLADLINGGAGNDTLLGRDGDDDLYGDAGDDALYGGRDADHLYGGAGKDRLQGEDGDDILRGGEGDDVLTGGDGADTLYGGLGADKLNGGAGADTFVFDLSEVGAIDLIVDFNFGEGDRILITGISASSGPDLNFVQRGRVVYLELETATGSVDIAKIQGADLDALQSLADAGLLLA